MKTLKMLLAVWTFVACGSAVAMNQDTSSDATKKAPYFKYKYINGQLYTERKDVPSEPKETLEQKKAPYFEYEYINGQLYTKRKDVPSEPEKTLEQKKAPCFEYKFVDAYGNDITDQIQSKL